MTPDVASLIITLVVVIGTALNGWISLRVRADISDLKFWVANEFVSKEDCKAKHELMVLNGRNHRG